MFNLLQIVSVRHLFGKNRFFTLINIVGLAVSFACILTVVAFIASEYSFDSYHAKSERIYRIILDFESEGVVTNWAKTSAPIGEHLTGSYPEVEQVVRLRKNPGTDLLGIDQSKFYEDRVFFADSTLTKVFDFKFLRGNPKNVLNEKNSIVLSEKLAYKLFGDIDVLGKSIRYSNQIDLKVTGVMADMPPNSHFIADAFVTFSSLNELLGEKRLSHWGQFDHYTYVLLTKNSSPKDLESKFPILLRHKAPEWVQEKEKLFLQPLLSIHLHSDRKDEISPNSKEAYSYILGTIAAFIVLMASTNFINLSTATQIARTKEVNLKKILGASTKDLVITSYAETLIICLLALALALMLGYVALPNFTGLINRNFTIDNLYIAIIVTVIVTLVVVQLSALFSALNSWKAKASHIGRPILPPKSPIRFALVAFQFFVSIFLIVATSIASNQVAFLESVEFGFEGQDIIVIPIKDRSLNDKYQTICDEIRKIPGVINASFSSSTPGSNNSLTYTYTFIGTERKDQAIATFIVDENFEDLYRLSLTEGKFFVQRSNDTLTQVIVNEQAVKELGITEPIGQVVSGKVKGMIVGVVQNFNHATLHKAFEPVIMYPFTPTFRFVSVKLQPDRKTEAIKGLERKWQEWYTGFPMEYYFLVKQNNALYGSERILNKLYLTFSGIAIAIAAVGLIGFTSFQLERKKKQISIRKVLGGTSTQMIKFIYSSYVPVITVSAIIAWSAAYYWMNRWLSEFANRTEVGLVDFILPTSLMIVVLLISTGLQSLRASLRNPIDNLRDE